MPCWWGSTSTTSGPSCASLCPRSSRKTARIDELWDALGAFSARTVSTIASITDDNQLNPTAVLANSDDSDNGGSSVVAAYQVNVGLDTTVSGNGWGAGTWGRGTWGSGTSLTATGATLRIWSHDNFGEDLIFCIRDAGIFYWDKSAKSAPMARAVRLNELAGADSTVPTKAKVVLVSEFPLSATGYRKKIGREC